MRVRRRRRFRLPIVFQKWPQRGVISRRSGPMPALRESMRSSARGRLRSLASVQRVLQRACLAWIVRCARAAAVRRTRRQRCRSGNGSMGLTSSRPLTLSIASPPRMRLLNSLAAATRAWARGWSSARPAVGAEVFRPRSVPRANNAMERGSTSQEPRSAQAPVHFARAQGRSSHRGLSHVSRAKARGSFRAQRAAAEVPLFIPLKSEWRTAPALAFAQALVVHPSL